MTINEAEQQYRLEVAYEIEQFKNKAKKAKRIWAIVSSVLISVGIVLTIIGFMTPHEIESWGESIKIEAIFEISGGISLIWIGTIFMVVLIPSIHISQKKGPSNFLPQIKNLYLNYLKCEGVSTDEKEFYKQKLEEIRNMELVSAISRAGAAASAAIMFNTIHR